MLRRLAFVLVCALLFAFPAVAQDKDRSDDTVGFDLSAEDWVTTKTARVVLNVEAAVSAANAGTVRTDMAKTVNDIAKTDWRLTNFNRSQDQTGMERWSVNFEGRLPESSLGGLHDAAKKASKPGAQITVGEIDFSPTLDEMEAGRAALRTRILKTANDQLATLNATLPGRGYRIMEIVFGRQSGPIPMFRNKTMMAVPEAMVASGAADSSAIDDRSQKIWITAHIVYGTPAPPPASR